MTSIMDLRKAFYGGGVDAEIAYLLAAEAAGLDAADMLNTMKSSSALGPRTIEVNGYLWPRVGNLTVHGISNQNLRSVQMWSPIAFVGDRINIEITTGAAGAVIRLLVYADDGTGLPGALLTNCGTIAGDTTGVKEITSLAIPVPVGIFHCAILSENAAVPSYRGMGSQTLNTYRGLVNNFATQVGASSMSKTGIAAVPDPYNVVGVGAVGGAPLVGIRRGS